MVFLLILQREISEDDVIVTGKMYWLNEEIQ